MALKRARVEARMTHACTDMQCLVVHAEPIKPLDIIYVDQMARAAHAKRQNGRKALSASEDAAILWGNFCQNLERVRQSARPMVDEGSRLHIWSF